MKIKDHGIHKQNMYATNEHIQYIYCSLNHYNNNLCGIKALSKAATHKGKNLLPCGSKLFPLREASPYENSKLL